MHEGSMQIFGLIICSLVMTISTTVFKQQHYDTTWNSLLKYTVPQWYLDAKFGIYHHWGIYSVPDTECVVRMIKTR